MGVLIYIYIYIYILYEYIESIFQCTSLSVIYKLGIYIGAFINILEGRKFLPGTDKPRTQLFFLARNFSFKILVNGSDLDYISPVTLASTIKKDLFYF